MASALHGLLPPDLASEIRLEIDRPRGQLLREITGGEELTHAQALMVKSPPAWKARTQEPTAQFLALFAQSNNVI